DEVTVSVRRLRGRQRSDFRVREPAERDVVALTRRLVVDEAVDVRRVGRGSTAGAVQAASNVALDLALELAPLRLAQHRRDDVLPETRQRIAAHVRRDLCFGAVAPLIVWPRVRRKTRHGEMYQRRPDAAPNVIDDVA